MQKLTFRLAITDNLENFAMVELNVLYSSAAKVIPQDGPTNLQ